MERLRIQQAMVDLVNAAKFYQVTYGTDGKPVTYDPSVAPNVSPASAQCNEIAEKFGIDKNFGQDLILTPVSWTFELMLAWQVEVDLSFFEQSLMRNPPFIPASGVYRSVRLYMLGKSVQHPVKQDAATGTQAKYLFNADLGRQ